MNTETREIFITSYNLYNQGRNVLDCGGWIEISSDLEELKERVEELIESIDSFGEEWFISDSQGFVCSEHESLEEIAKKEELFEIYDDEDRALGRF